VQFDHYDATLRYDKGNSIHIKPQGYLLHLKRPLRLTKGLVAKIA
jgi:hypothetical protein